MPVPSVDEMEALLEGKSKKKKAKPAKYYVLYVEQADGSYEAKKFNVSDPEEKADFDVEKQAGALTPAQFKKEQKEGKSSGSLTRDIGRDIGREFSRKLTRKGSGRVARGRLSKRIAATISKPIAGSALAKALPIALRLSAVAAAVGAAWYLSKKVDEKRLADKVATYAANQEAFLKRPMTEKELATYLPIWRGMAEKTLNRQRIYAPTGPTTR